MRPESDKWCGRHATKDDACPACTLSLAHSQRSILGSFYWNQPLGKVDGHTVRTMKALARKGLLKEDADGFSITAFGRIVYGRGRG